MFMGLIEVQFYSYLERPLFNLSFWKLVVFYLMYKVIKIIECYVKGHKCHFAGGCNDKNSASPCTSK